MKRSIEAGVEPAVLTMTREASFAPYPQSEQSFGNYLRRELRARKWSVRYLALRSGVNHSTISRLMQHNRTPTLHTVMRIQAAFTRRDGTVPLPRESELWMDPVQRVRDALDADPALDLREVEQVVRYYRMVRTSRPALPARGPEPAASIRRVLVEPSRR